MKHKTINVILIASMLVAAMTASSVTVINAARAQSLSSFSHSSSPTNLEATLALARDARARFDFAGALRLLDAIAKRHPNTANLLAEYGMLYLAAEEPDRSLAYFDRALRIDPQSEAATIGRAGVALLQRDYKSAEARLRECLMRNPDSNRARAMLAQVHLENNKNGEAAAEAERALALEPRDADALYALAFVRASERKPDEVRLLARRALALDRLNPGLRRLLSQYLDGRAGYEQKIAEAARKRYERGQALKQEGKLSDAVSEFEAALRIEPRYYRALLALGDIWLRDEDYERAAAAARLAIDIDPEGALAHLELSYAQSGIKEKARIEIGAVDFAALFYKQHSPPRFELTARIFPNYNSLSRRQQIVIDTAVAPLAGFLPRLAQNRARHLLLSFDQRVSDISDFDDVAQEKTFDGRYYASVRGVGGRVTVSGIEYIDLAARGGFHTIAHEFAHQVHMVAMAKEDARTIRKLYERAMRESRTLDFYAAANEFEYFAQGYEAFVSTHKRPSAGVTARHTNRELLTRDPALYRFLVELTSRLQAASTQTESRPRAVNW